MSQTINFGIDLGTTNSVIGQYREGKVEIFRNPLGHKETLPSVVAFRKSRIQVGDKAREYLERDPKNVVGTFKRKMGTSVRYHIDSTGEFLSPVDLSAYVLKELKNFVYTGEQVEGVVITIPASFDTVQSNATKEAGFKAGFRHVTLLQEPIAASLAYANLQNLDPEEEDKWLVYDLGGGTFDVALVQIREGEMRVIDHEGDNFLGGTDFDALIIEHLLVPYLEKGAEFSNLLHELKSATGRYNQLWFALLNKAEEAKVILSSQESAEIEFEIEDDQGEEHDILYTLMRNDFEKLIEGHINRTLDMIREMLERNSLSKSALSFVLMVGGSTYIPYVRRSVGDQLGIPVNCDIDPSIAVGQGAAFYAGTKPLPQKQETEKSQPGPNERALEIKMAFQKTSQEETEYFSAKIEGEISDLWYRIIREDKGYDSGLKQVEARIEEDLPLIPGMYNVFRLSIYDSKNNLIKGDLPEIGITQGKFSVTGQPLPNDICIEIDDLTHSQTRLEAIFHKNEILPLRRTFTKEITRTIRKGSQEKIILNVLEGPEKVLPSVNQPIGFIAISGSELDRDLVKGSDIEITLEISESRDLRISAFLLMTDQEFTNLFSASERHVHIDRMLDELEDLLEKAGEEMRLAERQEEFEMATRFSELETEIQQILDQIRDMASDDVTDKRFQLEDRKRRIAREMDELTRDTSLTAIISEYFEQKKDCRSQVEKNGSEAEKRSFEEIISNEKELLGSGNSARIRDAKDRLWELQLTILWRSMEFLEWQFYSIESHKHLFSDPKEGERLLNMGREGIQKKEQAKLQIAISGLHRLLPHTKRSSPKRGTGIG